MKKSAVVRFIGNQEEYRLHCENSNFKYCRDCNVDNCKEDPRYLFVCGRLYNAYFLEYWQGERTSLHVKGEDGEVHDFIPFEEFEVVLDEDDVLNTHEAIVRCITHEYDDELFDLNYGNEYKAIGFDENGQYLVMDECYDCYFYSSRDFEVVSDPFGVLDMKKSTHIYDWENTHIDSV